MPKISIHPGEAYGRLTVCRRAKNDKSNRPVFECRCACGNSTLVRSNALRTGNTKSCGCLRSERSSHMIKTRWTLECGVAAFRALYASYRQGALRRNLSFSITINQFKDMVRLRCHYCGVPPSQRTNYAGVNGQYVYNGIDRLDNSKGYSIQNTVPCCKTCNWSKGKLSCADFLGHIKQIIEFQHRS